jgi:putative FmdB family regulatory protein
MPIYEYRCGECGHETEVLQRISEAPLTDCPQCGKPALSKLVSAAGFQLKGTGWYVTDFRNKGDKPAAKGNGKDSKTADAAKPAEGGSSDKASVGSEPAKSSTEAKA